MMSGVASAPGSSGNLGPGFDCVALALDLRCEVKAVPADEWALEQDGETRLPAEGDYVVRAVRAAVDMPMHLTIENAIPRSRGLGSSSAVAAAAAAAARRALDLPCGAAELFEMVSGLEGHADNAAAAVYGGLVLTSSSGGWRHLELSPRLRFVVAVPDEKLSTHRARAALPAAVRLSAAARNLSRLGFLIEGLRTGEPGAFLEAAGDELHEGPRRDLSPITGELMDVARAAGALHAAWSGAGPSALAFCLDDAVTDVMSALERRLGGAGSVRELSVALEGIC
ncbi:MAG: homoserine kinase [Acidimicrobiia bacterium]